MRNNRLQTNSIFKKYQNLLGQINDLEDKFKILSDNELKAENLKLKKQFKTTQSLDSIVAKSFAITREASFRTLGLKPFDVQLLGGLVLNNQEIAEMKTGEGKTLVATLPSSLNALTDKNIHIVTVNDYLASRDHITMRQIYNFLGLTAGLIQTNMSTSERRENYQTNITYVTNYELTFDFLRDNMVVNSDDLVLNPFNYCIIDEVDSILIDEAQTPLILSNSIETPIEKYLIAAEVVNYLEFNIHYIVNEKQKNVVLTETGTQQVEQILKIQDLYDPRDPWIPYIMNALKAKVLFFNNVHYIVQSNRIIIVDEFTGRIMPDRRWGDGLHQAIEAKENVPIRQKSETIAAITYQNFFRLYPKLAGMTGTGKTAEIEFKKIYSLAVQEIPTVQMLLRKDLPDLVYKNQFAKWNAIAKKCNEVSLTGQPVLVGTTTVEKSEMLGQLLDEYKLEYQILNARPENIRREAEIVAQAGKKGVVTIATNMAGRGTDIILGGNIEFRIQKELYNILTLVKNYKRSTDQIFLKFNRHDSILFKSQKFLSIVLSLCNDIIFLRLSDIEIIKILRESYKLSFSVKNYENSINSLIAEGLVYYKKSHYQENKIVKNLGGLFIIGTERNDSRRVDNQLRGRCGRQGDPGTSQFLLSLDDTLLRLFGGPKIQNFLQKQMNNDEPLQDKILTKSLDLAQERIEERAYQQRKDLFDYDEILNQQRRIIYFERRQILQSLSTQKVILSLGEQIITDLLLELKTGIEINSKLIGIFENLFGKTLTLNYVKKSNQLINEFGFTELKFYLIEEFWLSYQSRIIELEIYGQGVCAEFERSIILLNIDKIWKDYLQSINLLREAVGWRGYGQRNPLYEYKLEAVYIFEQRVKILRHLIIYDLLRSFII